MAGDREETTRMRADEGSERGGRRIVVAGALVAAVLAGLSACGGTDGGSPVATPAAPTPAPTVAPTGCASRPLPLPQDANGLDIRGVDPAGRYVLAVPNHNAVEMGSMLWTDGGQPQLLPGGKEITAEDVNASGVVVGTRHEQRANGDAAVLIRDGRVTRLPPPTGALSTTAVGINTRGDVVGTAHLATGRRAVLWRAGAATATLLGVGDRSVIATGINDDGVVIGNAGEIRHAYRWALDGTATPLPVPAGYLRAAASAVSGDWVLGWAEAERVEKDGQLVDDPDHPSRGVRWSLRTGAVEVLPKMVGPMAVGTSGATAGAIDGTGRPAIWRDGGVFVLPMPMPDPAPSVIQWIGPDGHTMIGTVRHDDLGAQLAVWQGC
jgi:hypothetical protein